MQTNIKIYKKERTFYLTVKKLGIFCTLITLLWTIAIPAKAGPIIFQDDNFATADSDGIILDNDDSVAPTGTITIQFGKTLGKIFQWDGTNNRFNLSDTLNVVNNLLVNVKTILGSSLTPQATLDVNGDFATRRSDITLSNGDNDNVDIGNASFIKITGPTAAFGITGIKSGTTPPDGKIITIYNSTTQNMTIYDQGAGQAANSTAAYRINSCSGANITTSGEGSASFIYEKNQSRWLLFENKA